MSSDNGQWQGGRISSGEDPVEVGRYIEALRRSRWLIVSIVTIITVAVAGYSLTLPKSYEATASIVVNNTSGLLGGNESAAIQRNLATTATLATTAAVLGEAAKSFPGETRTSLAKKVSASVAENANIITIKVQYGSAEGAATLAGAVAQAFLNQHASIERSQTSSALSALNGQIAALRARASNEPNIAAQLSALQARAAELEAQSAGTGTQLQLIQRPEVPASASSPRPTRNAVIALFASTFPGRAASRSAASSSLRGSPVSASSATFWRCPCSAASPSSAAGSARATLAPSTRPTRRCRQRSGSRSRLAPSRMSCSSRARLTAKARPL